MLIRADELPSDGMSKTKRGSFPGTVCVPETILAFTVSKPPTAYCLLVGGAASTPDSLIPCELFMICFGPIMSRIGPKMKASEA